MTIYALKDYVVVKANEPKKTTQSGIILTEATNVGDTSTGTVVSVGPEVKFLQEGHELIAQWGKSIKVSFDGVEHILIKEEDVIAIVAE